MGLTPRTRASRREVLSGLGASLALPFLPRVCFASQAEKPLRIGLIADLHHGLEPTAQSRIEEFVDEANSSEADGIVQLGDFNFATAENAPCMRAWNGFRGDRFHVLGNHDMDKVTKRAAQDFWEMEKRYYSFDRSGFHFVVLDRNNLRTEAGDVPYAESNYYAHPKQRAFADREQLEWLRGDLAATALPVVVFVHQGLGMKDGLAPSDPRAEIETILRDAKRAAAPGVVACFCGHEHLDRHRRKDGIHYVWINSASYYWVGSDYGRMAPYRDALFAFATFDPAGEIRIEGRQSDWVAPSPELRGYPKADEISAAITDRRLRREQYGVKAAAEQQRRGACMWAGIRLRMSASHR
ncbi:MAG: hypothetical protein GY711_31680 [bacterium]|nr:hypothetical protein [bacterium]